MGKELGFSMVDERCPSCKGYLNESEECELCGWTSADGRDVPAVEKNLEEDGEAEEALAKDAEAGDEDAGGVFISGSGDEDVSHIRCPSCRSFINTRGECEVCGWMHEDASPEEKQREEGINRLMKLHRISRPKAERLYYSRVEEGHAGEDDPIQTKSAEEKSGEWEKVEEDCQKPEEKEVVVEAENSSLVDDLVSKLASDLEDDADALETKENLEPDVTIDPADVKSPPTPKEPIEGGEEHDHLFFNAGEEPAKRRRKRNEV